uniref:Protein kinase domain-containing protein n=1 Tax=Rhizophagus irregularis (strain DAOM 181602 / DAOM 197198 / MUCL 43194) TaxID=747089 RepID=U9TZ46_RHIID
MQSVNEVQLKINDYNDTIFEWIPYYQIVDIKDLSNTIYLAKWKDGPLYWNGKVYTRNLENKAIILKYLVNAQNITNELLDEIIAYYNKVEVYGISQDPDTKYYIIIFNGDQYLENCCVCEKYYTNAKRKWCKPCQINWLKVNFTNWTSENKQINNIIQEVQLKINDYNDTIFEWIPYYQIVDIKDLNNTIYSAKWKDGPLYWNGKAYTRNLENKAVILKYLVNAQNELLDEITAYYNNLQIYGISQKPSTEDYIVVLNQEQYIKIFCNKCTNKYVNTEYKWCEACQKSYLKKKFTNWTSDNKQIDRLIQVMQLKINDVKDIIFEWIPYNQFSDIKEIGKGGFARVYSAKWKDGPLYWNKKKYTRDSNKTVALKCLNNSQNISNKFLNEVEAYSINNLNNTDNSGEILKIFGISQNPDTKDYIMVLQHARGGNFNNWLNNNYKNFNWSYKLKVLNNIINGLKEIHQKQYGIKWRS